MIADSHPSRASPRPELGTKAGSNDKSNGSTRLAELDRAHFERRQEREAASTYTAGTCDRMHPVPKGIDPLGTDADYHYRTERNYFLIVERGRAAVRNHPLVERGVNRLIANMRIGDYTLDVNSGDPAVDADQKAFWHDWCGDPKECDYEQQRTFAQKARQSFFSQVVDGDILHLPLIQGSLQTWTSCRWCFPRARVRKCGAHWAPPCSVACWA